MNGIVQRKELLQMEFACGYASTLSPMIERS